ncbi:MAG TPA: hypothetical protein VNH83_20370 [Bryobacteraceae bacterium]|nr:hypothetical protein [Bryobacteraceae bacterium]
MKLPAVLLLCAGFVFAQSRAVIVGAGYNALSPVSVAPGQVITVQVTGVGDVAQKVTAGGLPLPKKLAGISALLMQGDTGIPAPIMAVFPLKACPDGIPQLQCSSVTGITLQIPFELSPVIPGSLRPVFLTYLRVSDDAGHSASISLDPELDAIHVLHSLDTVVVQDMAQKVGSSGAVVTHADGTAVDALHPARVGEQLVMYAVGVGATNPAVATGAPSPMPPAPASGGFMLNFDFQPNAPPTPGVMLINKWFVAPPGPVFVGLTPNFVGLYQINFVVQSPPPGLLPCVRSLGFGANPFANVLSNLTVTLIGRTSFDGAQICVDTGTS